MEASNHSKPAFDRRMSSRRVATASKSSLPMGTDENEDLPTLHALPSVLQALASDSMEARHAVLTQLNALIDSLPAEDLPEVCSIIRGSGTCAVLVNFLDEQALHEDALLALSNIASDAVDTRAAETRARLNDRGVVEHILPHLWSESFETVLYALAALVHFVNDLSQVRAFRLAKATRRVEELTASDDDVLVQFAQSCLYGMRAAAIALMSIVVQSLVRGFLLRVRLRRARAAAAQRDRDELATEIQRAREVVRALDAIRALEAAADSAATENTLERAGESANAHRDAEDKASAGRGVEGSATPRVGRKGRQPHQSQSPKSVLSWRHSKPMRPLEALERSAQIFDPRGQIKPTRQRQMTTMPFSSERRAVATEPLLPLGLAGLDRRGLQLDGNGRILLPATAHAPVPMQIPVRSATAIPRDRHATFAQLRIADRTRAHQNHLAASRSIESIRYSGERLGSSTTSMPSLPSLGTLKRQSPSTVPLQLSNLLSQSSARLVDIFRLMDTNGNGRLEPWELKAALSTLGYEATVRDASWQNASLPTKLYSERMWLLRCVQDEQEVTDLLHEFGGWNGSVTYGDLKRALSQRPAGISWHAGWCRNTIKSRDGGSPGRPMRGRVRFLSGGPPRSAGGL